MKSSKISRKATPLTSYCSKLLPVDAADDKSTKTSGKEHLMLNSRHLTCTMGDA